MGAEGEWSSRRWKWVALTAVPVAAGLLAVLVADRVLPVPLRRVTDDRLIGTWQSDAERTIGNLRESRSVDDRQEANLRKLLGKLRVTYTPTTYTTEMDGTMLRGRYEVLGKDKVSVVIREIRDKPSPVDRVLELSEFSVIQFDGPDSYWVTSQVGGMQEYFKRVR